MSIVVVIIHIVVCFALILIVLLQTGKGADMGAAFGGSTQTVFGASGSVGFLGKLTTGAAIAFMLTSLTLAYLSGMKAGGGKTIMKDEVRQEEVAEPTPGEGDLQEEVAEQTTGEGTLQEAPPDGSEGEAAEGEGDAKE